jgi:IclR family transcriptional regulator, acetate operon repressor
MEANGKPPAYPIESVDRAMVLLLALEGSEGLGVVQASKLLGVSRSTAHRMLSILQYRGLARQDPRTRAYLAGPALLRSGLAAVRDLDARAFARPMLERIVAAVGETAHLVVLQWPLVFFLDSVEGSYLVRAATRPGTSLLAHCTAAGKALLAALPPERLDSLLADTKLERLTPRSVVSKSTLRRQLDEARTHGYAVSDGEAELGLRAVGAVIPQPVERLSVDVAVGVGGPEFRMTDERITEIAEIMLAHLQEAPTPA